MQPQLAVLTLSDSFADFWETTARIAGKVRILRTVEEVNALHYRGAVLISAPAMEDQLSTTIRDLLTIGVSAVAVVGTDTSHRKAVRLLQDGVTEYFAFPSDILLCQQWITHRLEEAAIQERGERFTENERTRFDFSNILGRSPLLRSALGRTARVIAGNAAVLITGETGTGKDLLARAIHYNGSRRKSPFVDLNCTALPENLLEAELFGYEPGAFTDARSAKPGLFEVADGGTLFLDEIGDLAPSLQAKLLRVLEQKQVRRLGAVRDITLDVRVIAATHVDLPKAVRLQRFRQDLFYRLNVVPIRLPALRDRGEDVILIAESFIDQFSAQYNLKRPNLTSEVRRALRMHAWPGNIRELRNSIERAILLGDGHIYVEDLFCPEATLEPTQEIPFPASMSTIERHAASAMVARCGGNKSEAAKELGISRKHLYSLLRKEETAQ
jgi:DNA-binding NtrC family response regulator